eukprot:415919_1
MFDAINKMKRKFKDKYCIIRNDRKLYKCNDVQSSLDGHPIDLNDVQSLKININDDYKYSFILETGYRNWWKKLYYFRCKTGDDFKSWMSVLSIFIPSTISTFSALSPSSSSLSPSSSNNSLSPDSPLSGGGRRGRGRGSSRETSKK